MDAARQALELARHLPDRALVAEALYRLSLVQDTGDKYDESEASIVQAIADAQASGRERLLALGWTQLIRVVGHENDHANEVERLIPFVEATVERFHPQGQAHVELLMTLGLLEHDRGRYEGAIKYFNAALDMLPRVFSKSDARRIEIYQSLANAERMTNQLDDGIAHTRLALADIETVFGSEHPQILYTLALLASKLSERGDSAGMQPVGQRALRIFEQESSTENPDMPPPNFT